MKLEADKTKHFNHKQPALNPESDSAASSPGPSVLPSIFGFPFVIPRSRNKSVLLQLRNWLEGRGIRGWFPAKAQIFFSSPKHTAPLWTPDSLISNGKGGASLGDNAAVAWKWLFSSTILTTSVDLPLTLCTTNWVYFLHNTLAVVLSYLSLLRVCYWYLFLFRRVNIFLFNTSTEKPNQSTSLEP